MVEKKNIIICGASCGGLSAAHYFLKFTYPALQSSHPSSKYTVHLIDPSTHFYWRVAAPRACVSPSSFSHHQLFTPILDGFTQYEEDAVVLHQGLVTGIDTSRHTVTFIPATSTTGAGGSAGVHSETIPYHALIIATGTKTPTPVTSLHGEHGVTIQALDNLNTRLQHAKDIVISGGGPVGVEVAGEIGETLNGRMGRWKQRHGELRAKITLIAGGDQLLPALPRRISVKAEQILRRVGVDVVYDARVTKVVLSTSDPTETGYDTTSDGYSATGMMPSAGGVETTRANSPAAQTIVHLSDGRTLGADVYIPATGVVPNTTFLPRELLNSENYVLTNPRTLRVDAAGPGARVYCIGDVGSYSAGGILDLREALLVIGGNMGADLHAAAMAGAAAPVGSLSFSADSGVSITAPGSTSASAFPEPSAYGSKGAVDALAAADNPRAKDKEYTGELGKSVQIVSVGTRGVGSAKGWRVPSYLVYMIKGKDYRIDDRIKIVHGTWEKTLWY